MRLVGLIAGLTLALLLSLPAPSRAQSVLSPAFAATDAGLSPEARAGREIWMFATAFNDRFFTYTYPQRLGGAIDWYGILRADRRQDLFEAWGAIPDPDCCVPGDPDCPARSSTETYGFLWCPGDDALLSFVGREGYRDPACDFEDAPFDTSTPHGSARPAPERLRPPFRHLDRRARLSQVSQSALRPPRAWDKAPRRLGRLRRLPLERPGQPPTAALQPALATARSSRRSSSAWPAAPATSPSIR